MQYFAFRKIWKNIMQNILASIFQWQFFQSYTSNCWVGRKVRVVCYFTIPLQMDSCFIIVKLQAVCFDKSPKYNLQFMFIAILWCNKHICIQFRTQMTINTARWHYMKHKHNLQKENCVKASDWWVFYKDITDQRNYLDQLRTEFRLMYHCEGVYCMNYTAS